MLRELLPEPARLVVRKVRALRANARGHVAENSSSSADVQGFSLTLPQHFQHHYVRHDYEPLSRAFLLKYLAPGMHAVDVGAHIGLYTLLMARAVGATGRVTSVEPAKENLRFLRTNITANGYSDRVTVVAAAATDHGGTVRFHLTGSSDSHGLHPHPNTPTKKIVELPAVRLDDVVGSVDFVKVDTEGAELSTLAGMTRALSSTRAALVEWAPTCQASAGHALTDLPEFLQSLGFEISVLDDHAGTTRSATDVSAGLLSGDLPSDWYGNIACLRRP